MVEKAPVEILTPILMRTSGIIGERLDLESSYVLSVMVKDFGLGDVLYGLNGIVKETRAPEDTIRSIKAYMRPIQVFIKELLESNTIILTSDDLRSLINYIFLSSVTIIVGRISEPIKRAVIPEVLKALYEYGSGATITIIASPTSYEWIKKYFIERLLEKIRTANINCYVDENVRGSKVLFDKGIVVEAGEKADTVYVSARSEDVYNIYLNALSISLKEDPVLHFRANIIRSTLIVPLLPLLKDLTRPSAHYDLKALVYSVLSNSVSVIIGHILGITETKNLVSLVLDTYDDIVNIGDIRSPKTDYVLINTDIKIGQKTS